MPGKTSTRRAEQRCQKAAERSLHTPRSIRNDNAHQSRGFSLLELLVVISVAVILTGLLFPAMSTLRENANRVICSSNLRQIGLATMMYAQDNNDRLPATDYLSLENVQPRELMAVTDIDMDDDDIAHWDGLGLLYQHNYCRASDCFYCPSHKGDHPAELYTDVWLFPDHAASQGKTIYTNYHYGGHVQWDDPSLRRRLEKGDQLVLATDGLRSRSDFNHGDGMNILRGDFSVLWSDATREIVNVLPSTADDGEEEEEEAYVGIWNRIESLVEAE